MGQIDRPQTNRTRATNLIDYPAASPRPDAQAPILGSSASRFFRDRRKREVKKEVARAS